MYLCLPLAMPIGIPVLALEILIGIPVLVSC